MKKIVFLCGALLSAPMMGMELEKNGDLLCPNLRQIIINNVNISFLGEICKVLGCINKRLSEEVPYEKAQARAGRSKINPLNTIIYRNAFKGTMERRDRYLKVAERFLINGFNPNSKEEKADSTLLQKAAAEVACVDIGEEYRNGFKALCRLFLKHGADPFLITIRSEPQGPSHAWTAFDYANKGFWYGEGDDQPRGWLKEMWDEIHPPSHKATADK